MERKTEKTAFLRKLWLAMAAALVPGAAALLLEQGGAFAAGWFWAGLVAGAGLWLALRGARQGRERFLRLLLSGMAFKLAAYGAAVFLVVGLQWLDRDWFVAGLLGGMLVFMSIEVIALARKGAALLAGEEKQGATGDA